MMVPGRADRARRVELMCDRTMMDVSRLSHRVKTVVRRDVSLLGSRAISPCISLSKFPFISIAEDSYHLNVFGGPPVLPRVIGIPFLEDSCPIHQASEVCHRSAEQRFVTVATFEHAHDSTLGPLIGKCTDILRETIEKRGWDQP